MIMEVQYANVFQTQTIKQKQIIREPLRHHQPCAVPKKKIQPIYNATPIAYKGIVVIREFAGRHHVHQKSPICAGEFCVLIMQLHVLALVLMKFRCEQHCILTQVMVSRIFFWKIFSEA